MDEVLERGDISFFWRPAVQPADGPPLEAPGVQSFFVVLSTPAGTHRRVRIGKKRMPRHGRDRFWARVERVGSFGRVVGEQLEDERYTTKTRGERYQPGARPIAHGSYEIVRHDDHCHLSYRVDWTEPDEPPEEISVPEEGRSLVLFERSGSAGPRSTAAGGAESKTERVPRTNATWTTEGGPGLLDEEGAELVLVGAGCGGVVPAFRGGSSGRARPRRTRSASAPARPRRARPRTP